MVENLFPHPDPLLTGAVHLFNILFRKAPLALPFSNRFAHETLVAHKIFEEGLEERVSTRSSP